MHGFPQNENSLTVLFIVREKLTENLIALRETYFSKHESEKINERIEFGNTSDIESTEIERLSFWELFETSHAHIEDQLLAIHKRIAAIQSDEYYRNLYKNRKQA